MATLATIEPASFQFEQATVRFTNDRFPATGRAMPKLYVQAIDAYGYQRELTVMLAHKPGDSKVIRWVSHIYRHPGRRARQQDIPRARAEAFVVRFVGLCQAYPALLFNPAFETRPRHEGFVRLAERLHDGAPLSKTLL